MNITIDGKYVIQRDKYQFILRELAINKEGEEVIKSPTYHPKLSDLIRALIMRGVTKATIESLQDMETEITRIGEKVAQAFYAQSPNLVDISEFD
jgi:hypothetical protein